ncbi:hypothetical protein M409DRAFT_15982 [Zasmidium cellare ATCC 36951]|uniref:F-box domain-containing protein n=1 Tax=Zasmidium cellare ATCC 36951 TaxID=1080233 RepID=A0A6A6D5M0_ZASCE|nr:uncharacterized protein M409DRAFT_15982 [Zasmidium cellare ATCC 36951]KAF2173708.1 hypothetical protein M409DRAFT_15982 [Zasmidium cellare ATCC 36951]
MDDPTTISKKKMNIFSLPGELRNRIYQHLVLRDAPINVVELKWTKDRTGYLPALIPQPALAQTCKTLRQEVLSLYCAENRFQVGVTSGGHQLCMTEVSESLERWASWLGQAAKHLRQVTISANCEIMGPKNAAYWLRDFWEIIEFSIRMDGTDGLQYHLRGDPSFNDLCTCELDRWVADTSPTLMEVVLQASILWFNTTDLKECEVCNRPCLREPAKVNDHIYIS